MLFELPIVIASLEPPDAVLHKILNSLIISMVLCIETSPEFEPIKFRKVLPPQPLVIDVVHKE